jgi:hypothetical protein
MDITYANGVKVHVWRLTFGRGRISVYDGPLSFSRNY